MAILICIAMFVYQRVNGDDLGHWGYGIGPWGSPASPVSPLAAATLVRTASRQRFDLQTPLRVDVDGCKIIYKTCEHLVVTGTWLIFSHIFVFIIPTDERIFFRGVETTNQMGTFGQIWEPLRISEWNGGLWLKKLSQIRFFSASHAWWHPTVGTPHASWDNVI